MPSSLYLEAASRPMSSSCSEPRIDGDWDLSNRGRTPGGRAIPERAARIVPEVRAARVPGPIACGYDRGGQRCGWSASCSMAPPERALPHGRWRRCRCHAVLGLRREEVRTRSSESRPIAQAAGSMSSGPGPDGLCRAGRPKPAVMSLQ